MRKKFLLLFVALFSYISLFGQAKSLTVDCQNPGWLSYLIKYGDQLTVKNLKVTGYINSNDMKFIGLLMDNSLNGQLNLSEVNIVKDEICGANEIKQSPFGLSEMHQTGACTFFRGKHST